MSGEIDLAAVRAARRNLEAIAVDHPELLGESSVEEWVVVLEEVEHMTKTVQVGVRFPAEVVELIDRFAEESTTELREKFPGLEVNRAGAIRILVEQALRDRGYENPMDGSIEPTAAKKQAKRSER